MHSEVEEAVERQKWCKGEIVEDEFVPEEQKKYSLKLI